MKILVLTDLYDPYPSANGICMRRLIKPLVEKGNEVIVLSYNSDNKDDVTCIDNVKIHKVKAPLFFRLREKRNKTFFDKVLYSICRFFRYLRIIIYNKQYPLIYPGFAHRYSAVAIEIIEKEKIDKLISEYIPIEAMYAGLQAKRVFNNIGLIVYVVDTFTQCPNALNHKRIRESSERWENKMIDVCDKYFYIESFRDYYSKQQFQTHQHKMIPVGLPLIADNTMDCNATSLTRFTFLYTGSWGGERDPTKILDAINKIKNIFNVKFVYCGKENELIHKLMKKYDFLSYEGFKTDDELKEIYKKTNCLVNIGNSTGMLPSKLFSYISTGLPIMHLYIYEHDPCISLLKDYDAASTILLSSLTSDILLEEIKKIKDLRVEYDSIRKHYKNYVPDDIVRKMIQ